MSAAVERLADNERQVYERIEDSGDVQGLAWRVEQTVAAHMRLADERVLAWIDDQRQLLPERRTPAAHGKAELLRDLGAYIGGVS